jgi:hypothetical protein
MLVIEEERLLRRLWPSACRSPRPRSSAGLLRVSYRWCTSAVPAGSARSVCWNPRARRSRPRHSGGCRANDGCPRAGSSRRPGSGVPPPGETTCSPWLRTTRSRPDPIPEVLCVNGGRLSQARQKALSGAIAFAPRAETGSSSPEAARGAGSRSADPREGAGRRSASGAVVTTTMENTPCL